MYFIEDLWFHHVMSLVDGQDVLGRPAGSQEEIGTERYTWRVPGVRGQALASLSRSDENPRATARGSVG